MNKKLQESQEHWGKIRDSLVPTSPHRFVLAPYRYTELSTSRRSSSGVMSRGWRTGLREGLFFKFKAGVAWVGAWTIFSRGQWMSGGAITVSLNDPASAALDRFSDVIPPALLHPPNLDKTRQVSDDPSAGEGLYIQQPISTTEMSMPHY